MFRDEKIFESGFFHPKSLSILGWVVNLIEAMDDIVCSEIRLCLELASFVLFEWEFTAAIAALVVVRDSASF